METNKELPIIDVTSWKRDDELSIYPYGAKAKTLLESPENSMA